MKYFSIEHTYTATAIATVELPEGVDVDDIEMSSIKWGTLHLWTKDGTHHEIDVSDYCTDTICWKRPNTVAVYPCDEDGQLINYGDIKEQFGF